MDEKRGDEVSMHQGSLKCAVLHFQAAYAPAKGSLKRYNPPPLPSPSPLFQAAHHDTQPNHPNRRRTNRRLIRAGFKTPPPRPHHHRHRHQPHQPRPRPRTPRDRPRQQPNHPRRHPKQRPRAYCHPRRQPVHHLPSPLPPAVAAHHHQRRRQHQTIHPRRLRPTSAAALPPLRRQPPHRRI